MTFQIIVLSLSGALFLQTVIWLILARSSSRRLHEVHFYIEDQASANLRLKRTVAEISRQLIVQKPILPDSPLDLEKPDQAALFIRAFLANNPAGDGEGTK